MALRVLIIDDSSFMRALIQKALADRADEIETAYNGEVGLEKIPHFQPDLVTLDIEMPRLDGLEVLRRLREMKLPHPPRVLMVSHQTHAHAQMTLEALSLGATDFLCKPDTTLGRDMAAFKQELLDKVDTLLQIKPQLRSAPTPERETRLPTPLLEKIKAHRHKPQTIIIGASTGGPSALAKLAPRLAESQPAQYLIIQHMPPPFTQSLAHRLDGLTPFSVQEAAPGDRLAVGQVFVAAGNHHLVLENRHRLALDSGPTLHGVRPSVDVTVFSAVEHLPGDQLIGVILTGMGRDGLAGMKKLVEKGGICLAESQETATIYGMPRAVIDAGVADVALPLYRIPTVLQQILGPNRGEAHGG